MSEPAAGAVRPGGRPGPEGSESRVLRLTRMLALTPGPGVYDQDPIMITVAAS